MKNRLALMFMLVFISSISFAQLKYGFQGGLNLSTFGQNYENSDEESEYKLRLGYKLGFVVDYSLMDALSLRSGLNITSKGAAFDLEEDLTAGVDVDGHSRVIINYLEIPLNAAYSLGPVRAVGGFYFAAGITGKSKYDYTYSGEFGGITFSETEKGSDDIDFNTGEVDPDNDNAELNRFDFGVNIGVEYDISPVTLSLSYAKGFSNLALDDPSEDFDRDDYKTTNSTLSLGVIYFLGN